MKKQNLLITSLFLLILITCTINGQRRGRWYQIQKSDIKTTFIDSTTVKVTEDQVSVWVLEIFNDPFEIENSNDKAKRSRTQYLFNTTENNFTVIGNLYYDEIGKIISQNYNPIIGGSGRTFYQPINDDENVKEIYNGVTGFLGIETAKDENENSQTEADSSIARRIEDLQKEIQDSTDSNSESSSQANVNDDSNIIDIGQPAEPGITLLENDIGPDKDPLELPYKTNELPDDARVAQIYNPVSGDYIELVGKKEIAVKPEPVEEEKPLETEEYDVSKERNVTSTIFTDGQQFCFQVSSWKRKNIAENEVNRLKNKGHNAYYVEARPRNKQGVWYRVRVGYFTTQAEAREYQRKVR